jgi:metallo-beta-lactamase family protein
MKLHFYGGAQVVTGVCYLLEIAGPPSSGLRRASKKILIDCGLFQGTKELEQKNLEQFVFNPKEIDYAVVSHSHLDHVGRLPQLIKDGFKGKIFATPPTIDFTRLILEDSVHILTEKAKKAGVVPIFGTKEIQEVMNHFVLVDYYQKTQITDNIWLTLHDAGHILGSAIIEIEAENKKIVFSGDLGNPPAPLVRPPDFLKDDDYVVVESTYGDSNHEPAESCKEMIENAVEDTVARGGVLLIPSFALERTQQLLYHLNSLIENHRIPQVPIFIDSPLAMRITESYKRYPQYYNQRAVAEIDSGDDIFNFPGLKFTPTQKESKTINDIPSPKIIIAGSGMSQGGRVVHHEVRYLSDPKTTLLLVSYQAEGTLGRKIADGAKKVEILDQEIEINARIEKISGYSAHADQRFLMKWLKSFRKTGYVKDRRNGLVKIFVVQGEEKPANTLTSLIKDELGVESEVPKIGDVFEL